jgi:integrase/recombinase XerD
MRKAERKSDQRITDMPRAKNARLSENSERTYREYAEDFSKWLNGRKPTVEMGEAYLAHLTERGLKRNSVGVAGRALRRVFSLDVPVPSIEMMEPHYLAVDQVKKLIETAPTLLEKTIIILLFSSACRISEILNLTKDDLELDKGVATVTRKGGRRERVALGPQGTEALQIWLKRRKSKSRRVFMDFTYNNMYYRLKLIAEKAGIPFTAHWLRHSRVMHLRLAGRDWPDISEICGHTRVETTMKIYGRRRAEERSELLVDF